MANGSLKNKESVTGAQKMTQVYLSFNDEELYCITFWRDSKSRM